MPARPPNSVDVARAAGVSRATVSHVLDGQVQRFAPETVRRVREAAERLGYVRSAAGRALVMGRSDFVVLAIPHLAASWVHTVVEAISADMAELGFSVVVHFRVSAAERAESARLHHLVEALRPAGVVDLGGMSCRDVAALEEAGWPVVPSPSEPDADGNVWIGRLQARHLCDRGYVRLALCVRPEIRDDAYAHARLRGLVEVCELAGRPRPRLVVIPADAGGARDALGGLLAGPGRPLGLAVYDVGAAESIAAAAAELGVAVPAELGLVGGQDDEGAGRAAGWLTTVSGDLAVLLGHVRRLVGDAYGGPGSTLPRLDPAEALHVIQGRTT